MKSAPRPSLFLLAVLLLLGSPRFGTSGGSGTTGADILKLSPGVRPAALAGVYSGLGDDAYVLGFNPAGLARVAKISVGLDHREGFAGVRLESLSAAVPTRRHGVLGLQALFRHLPIIRNDLASDPPVEAYDLVFTLGNARRFGRVAIGGAFKTVVSKLAEKQALTSALDLGATLQAGTLALAAGVQNVGPDVRFEPNPQGKDPLPVAVRVGVARPIWVKPTSALIVGAEALHRHAEGFQGALGAEYWHRSLVALRAGWREGEGESLEYGPAFGAAVRHRIGRLESEVGYAWRPARVQEGFHLDTHLFGLLLWY